jgi:hypothetical protein
MVDPLANEPQPPHAKVEVSPRHLPEPALPMTAFVLDTFCADDQLRLRAVLEDVDFIEAADRREQVVAACKLLRPTDTRSRFPYAAIARFFGGVNQAVIERQEKLGRRLAQEPGRPRILSDEIQNWICELVNERFRQHNPITYAELLDIFQYRHSIVVSADYLRHLIRRTDEIKTVIGLPMEAERVAVDPDVLAAWYQGLAEKIDGAPPVSFSISMKQAVQISLTAAK